MLGSPHCHEIIARLTEEAGKAAAYGTSLSGSTNLPVGIRRYIDLRKRGINFVENHQILEGQGHQNHAQLRGSAKS